MREPSAPPVEVPVRLTGLNPLSNEEFQQTAARDRWGHRTHVAATVLYVGALGMDTAPASITFGILFVVAVVRLPRTWPLYRMLLQNDCVGWLLAAWAALNAVSLLWSPDRAMGWDEVKAFRVILTTLMIWPVIDYAAWMIAALLIAIAAQNAVQLGQAMNWVARGPWDGPRLRGMMHPISTATLCVMAMCLHLSAVVSTRGWVRWACLVGLVVAGMGLVATGSRGPWIAAACALPLAAVSLAIRKTGVAAPKTAVVLALVVLVAATVAWPIVGHHVINRIELAKADIRLMEQGDYSGSIGYRLASWQAAWDLFKEKPLAGQGAGTFGAKAVETPHGKTLHRGTHAHSIYLQTLSTTGVIGGILLLIILISVVIRAWRCTADHPFASGIVFALIAWQIAGLFDALQLNGQLFGVFVALAALCLPGRPTARPLPWTSPA